MKRNLEITFAIALVFAVGCAGGARSIRVTDERSFDGLREVRNPRFGAVWVADDFDLSGYTKVRLEGAGIEFRNVGATGGSRNRTREFPISERGQQDLSDIMENAFRRELARSSRFELTEAVGPDVLTVWGGLLDVVSFVPPERPGRSDIWLRSVGEATLVIELRDSQSNATLARIVDRRAAEQTSTGTVANTVTTTAEVRRLATNWARLFRQRLDQAPSILVEATN
jgi:hypothetical protein